MNQNSFFRVKLLGGLLPSVLGIGLCLQGASSAQEQPKPLERIVVVPGENGAQFMLKDAKTPFFAKGFNYVRLRAPESHPKNVDHSTFDADTKKTKAAYDPEKAEAALVAMKQAGFNTTRVFIIGRNSTNPGIAGDYDTTKGIYGPYMDNFLDFLRRATRHGIRVLPTLGDGELPYNAYYHGRFKGQEGNKSFLLLTKEGVEARVEYISEFLSYIKKKEPSLLPTLLGVQCQNEAYLRSNEWPLAVKKGQFKAANGKTYDMANTESRQALADEGYLHFYEQVHAAVKKIDPEMLLTEGVFMHSAVKLNLADHAGLWPGKKRDPRYPPSLLVLGKSKLDFLDAHFYRVKRGVPMEEAVKANLGSSGFFAPEMAGIRKKKPVIIAEFGSHRFIDKTFEDAMVSMVSARDALNSHRVNGMLYWTYDCHEQTEPLHHATANWKLFVEKMGNFQPK